MDRERRTGQHTSPKVPITIPASSAMAPSKSMSSPDLQSQGGASRREFDVATRYQTVDVEGVKIFFREAGSARAPVLLLLHGYPSSSRMFEPLLPLLADKFRVIAPDYPGFGLSEAPDRSDYRYTFDQLAHTMAGLIDKLGLAEYCLFLQDYGGPIGMRLAVAHPHRVKALIVQNAVVHEEGLTAIWDVRRAYWRDRAANEAKIRDGMYSVQSGVARHVGGRPHPERYNPDVWMDEIAFLKRPGMGDIQLDLVFDYRSNLDAYPLWQEYLRTQRPPTLVVWGVHDPIFSVEGARAILRDLPSAEVHLLEAGHFAIYDKPKEISQLVRDFLSSVFSNASAA